MNSPSLPSEIIMYNILTRSSLETIGRSRVVCKNWNETTHEEHFFQQFYHNTKMVSGIFFQQMNYNKHSSTFVSTTEANPISQLSLNFLPKPLKIKAATKKGLLVCLNDRYRIPRYLVCKPTTREWRFIPNPKTRYQTRAMAITVLGSIPLWYKILRLSYPRLLCVIHKSGIFSCLQAEIFDSRTWRWKQLSELIKFPSDEYLHTTQVTVRGSFYCLTTNNNIFVFDLEKESWEIFSLPSPLCELDYTRSIIQLVEYEGGLGLIFLVNKEWMELWMMENYREKTWRRIKNLNFECLIQREGYRDYAYPMALCNNDVMLINNYMNIMLFDFRNKSSKPIKLGYSLRGSEDFFRIESDFEPINLNNPPSRRASESKSLKNSILSFIAKPFSGLESFDYFICLLLFFLNVLLDILS
ncbi:hypothetical protein UlMin_005357 [Ulmus minor]